SALTGGAISLFVWKRCRHPGSASGMTNNIASGSQADLVRICPITMQAKAQGEGNADRGHRALLDVQRLEDQQIAAMLFQSVAHLHDPAITFRRILAARDE